MPSSVTVPGVLVRVRTVGLLLTGPSGSGKSETALDLMDRGHTLVADDAVTVTATPDGLRGQAPAELRGRLEVRGLGIQESRLLAGHDAVAPEGPVDLEVALDVDPDWAAWPRLEPALGTTTLAGQPLPRLTLPVAPGRRLALLLETVARLTAAGVLTRGATHE